MKRGAMVEISITSRQDKKAADYNKDYGKYNICIISRISQFTSV